MPEFKKMRAVQSRGPGWIERLGAKIGVGGLMPSFDVTEVNASGKIVKVIGFFDDDKFLMVVGSQ
ncbi:MAG: hypothetical protein Pars2KO_03120 [Parasphingorhabdus sp.]